MPTGYRALSTASCLGPVAFLVPGVKAHLSAIKPEFASGMAGKLRRQRRALGLSMEDAAAKVGVLRWTWGLWEAGRHEPPARYAEALKGFLADSA